MVIAHIAAPPYEGMMRYLSCQACHIPYALAGGVLFRDSTMGGAAGLTSTYYSEDPLDPSAVDTLEPMSVLVVPSSAIGEGSSLPACRAGVTTARANVGRRHPRAGTEPR